MGKRHRTKHVPEEIMEEILTNLPVKSLLRFKSVSKSWRSIVCTKAFTNAHLKQSSTNHHRLMICSRDNPSRNLTLTSSSLKSLLNDFNSVYYSPITSGDSVYVTSTTQILGSCNGLILLTFGFPFYLTLWNPSTRQVNNNIPPPPTWYERMAYGFGYDNSTGDYKIVSIVTSDDKPSETHMYSLKTKSWKKIANFDDKGCYPINRDPGKYLNGRLHWKASCGNKTAIVSLDLAQGKYDIVDLPQKYIPCVDNNNNNNDHLDVLGGYLCLVSHDNVWFMNKYGDPESWTSNPTFPDYGISIWLDENEDVTVALDGSLVNIYVRRTKSHAIYTVASGDILEHNIYFETLVSPSGR